MNQRVARRRVYCDDPVKELYMCDSFHRKIEAKLFTSFETFSVAATFPLKCSHCSHVIAMLKVCAVLLVK